MTDPFDWINAEYYWQDDMFYMDLRDEADPCENPFTSDDDRDDYPFDEEDYESFLDCDQQ